MKIKMKLAAVGMNMESATLVKWHRQPGESFSQGEVLYEIETEKVTQEVTAPGDGKLLEILVCPQCKGDLELRREAPERQWLDCAACALAYPIQDGIPVMLEEEARTLSEAELEQLRD